MATVRELFNAAGLAAVGPVRWGDSSITPAPGVYLVATSPDPDEGTGLDACPVDREAVRNLLSVRPEARVDSKPANEASVVERLRAMWVLGEPVVYIGLAGTSISDRVTKYYRTKIGARSPHAGGWPIKMLSNLESLWLYCAPCADPGRAELTMLRAFAAALSHEQRARLIDSEVVLPFANLELTKGVRKRHGFSGVKEPRRRPVPPVPAGLTPSNPAESSAAPKPLVTGSTLMTQTVTNADIENGRIRIPSRTKRLFPDSKQQIEVDLSGHRMVARWDPRFGPDRERSGVIAVGKTALASHTQPGKQLRVTTRGGVIFIG